LLSAPRVVCRGVRGVAWRGIPALQALHGKRQSSLTAALSSF